jgi:hypothetical protein
LGQADGAEICCGQVAGLIEEVPLAGDLVQHLVPDIKDRFVALPRVLSPSF